MTILQTKEFLNKKALEVPEIPISWLQNKIIFYEPDKKIKKYKKLMRTYILYEYKSIPWIIEVAYTWNEDFTKWSILSQLVFSCLFGKRVWKNAYYIMSWGYRANNEISFSLMNRTWKYSLSSYSEFSLTTWSYAYKARNWVRKLSTKNITYIRPIFETLYKMGLEHLSGYVLGQSNKPYVALEMHELISKQLFKEFVEWSKLNKEINLHTYQDFLKMARNRKWKDIFVDNWLELHDDWSGITAQREKKAAAKKDIEVWKSKVKEKDIYITPMKSKEEVIQFGNEMNNCLNRINFNYKEIFKIESYLTSTPLALYWAGGEIRQLYGFNNIKVNDDVRIAVKNKIKEVSNGTKI